jgi:hypothetical protein
MRRYERIPPDEDYEGLYSKHRCPRCIWREQLLAAYNLH